MVLIVDDESDVRDVIRVAFARAGYETSEAETADSTLSAVQTLRPAAVTLDINLNHESGYDVCRAIREVSDVPVIFLTARQDDFDHALGLELGADSFLTKPFSPRVLVAQVAAAIRRNSGATKEQGFREGLLHVDPIGRYVRVGEKQVDLSRTEFDLLATLVGQPGRAFEYAELLSLVWRTSYGGTHIVEVAMARLRRKLADAGASDVIETIRGVGYRLARRG